MMLLMMHQPHLHQPWRLHRLHRFIHSLNHMLNFNLSSLLLSSNKQESMAPPTVCIILTSLLHEGLGVVLRVHMCP